MTNGDVRIEVISELTGDQRPRVAAAVNLMRDLMLGEGDETLNEIVPPNKVAALRRKLKKDKGLIDWYKRAIRYTIFK